MESSADKINWYRVLWMIFLAPGIIVTILVTGSAADQGFPFWKAAITGIIIAFLGYIGMGISVLLGCRIGKFFIIKTEGEEVGG